MRKKIFSVLLILMVSFSFVNNVFAEEFVVSAVVDNTTIAKGNVASIKLNLKASETINSCLFKFESESNIEYVSISSGNGWNINENGVNGYVLTNSSDSNAQTNGQNIAELKYKINGDGKVTIKTVQCVSTVSETPYKYGDVTVSFTVKDIAQDTTLSNLTVSGGTMNPSNIAGADTQYIITLSSSTFGFSMTASNPDYQDDIVVKDISGNVISDVSKITFNDPTGQGMMPLTITVNKTTTYSLLVNYEKKEYDNSLKKVTINDKELELVSGQYEYEYTVDKDVSEVEIDAVLTDSENFKISSTNGGVGKYSITDVTYVTLEVVPKDSSSGAKSVTYTIEIKKEGSTGNVGGSTQEKPSSGNTGGTGSSTNTGSSNVNNNPGTGDISMILMAFILVVSLFGSVVLYQKNLQGYK